MRCMIVDDDAMSIELLAQYAGASGELEVVGRCANPVEALRELSRQTPDVLFLDMEMPGMSGLDLLGLLERRPHVIMVTGNPEHAVAAFDAEVIDYLVKPVTYPRFLRAVARVRRLAAPKPHSRLLFVRAEGRIVRFALGDIDRVEAQKDYVRIHMGDRSTLIHTTMKDIESRLPPDTFVRVHRSHIVRLDRIVDLEQNSLVVGRAVVPVGASYRQELLARMNAL